MSDLTRRSFMSSMAAIPFSVWFEKYAKPQTLLIRYDAYSPQGQVMLNSYAAAVKTMMATNRREPLSWVFQWYTHWIEGDPVGANKNNIINRIYGSGPSPQKALAIEMWETCQAHGDDMDENYFLPWHRMFVYFFERIVRKASANPAFTLPYWNYSTQVATRHGVLPPEFRRSGDPTFGSLYKNIRNVRDTSAGIANVNGGEAIDRYWHDPTVNPLGLSCLAQCTYKPNGAIQGFCQNIDGAPHGMVHVLVGNGNNMGAVPTAAGDPIFWLHHSNIDRLWASWNKGGRKNPTDDSDWMSQPFVFADENSNRVVATVKDFLDIENLGYTYEQFEPVPPPNPPCPTITAAAPRRHAVTANVVSLTALPVSTNLNPPTGAAAADTIASRVQSLAANRRLYLVLRNLRAQAQPGILYQVYFDMPSNTPINSRRAYLVGILNFFNIVGHGSHSTAARANRTPKFFSFEITELAKNLARQQRLSARPGVTIVPVGRPMAAASPLIGEISLEEQ